MDSVECLLDGSPGREPSVVVKGDDDTLTTDDRDDDEDESVVSEPDPEDDEAELSWRLDPSRSLSDWTVKVVVKGTKTVQTYHVHKSVLAIGPRRSTYFANAFQKNHSPSPSPLKPKPTSRFLNNQWSPDCLSVSGGSAQLLLDFSDATNSRLEVHPLAAQAFPVLLDYVYSSSGRLAIKTENATALHALSHHLEMKALRKVVNDFWMANMSMMNLCVYYQHARIFKDKKIQSFAEDYCAQHIFEVSESVVVDILTTVDPLFFLRVVSTVGSSFSLRLSLLIAVYCNVHKSELDQNMFLRLTAPSHLPSLEIKAARALLEIEDDICRGKREELTSLKTRCIEVLSENWSVACIKENKETEQYEFTMPRLFAEPLEEFTSQSLLCAKKRLLRAEQEKIALLKKNEEMKRELELMKREMKRTNFRYEGPVTDAESVVSKE